MSSQSMAAFIRLDLEIHLIRTIHRRKIPRNIRATVSKVATHWEIPFSDLFPRTRKIPQSVSLLEDRPPANPRKSLLLVTTFEVDTWGKLDFGYRPSSTWLGIDWIATYPEHSFLGKRLILQDSRTPGEGRQHKLTLSHMGVVSEIPQSPELNVYLDNLALQIPTLQELPSAVDRPAQFRFRYDDVCNMFDIQLFSDDPETPVARGVYFQSSITYSRERRADERQSYYDDYGYRCSPSRTVTWSVKFNDAYLDFDCPELSVYNWVSEMLSGQREVTDHGLLNLLNQIMSSASIWSGIFHQVSEVPPDQDFEQLIAPFLTLLKWVEPVYRLFFRPLVQHFHPELLETNRATDCKPKTFSDLKKYTSTTFWDRELQILLLILRTEHLIQESRSTRSLKPLITFWKSESWYSEYHQGCEFISQDVMSALRVGLQDPQISDRLRACLQPGLTELYELHGTNIQSKRAIPRIGLTVKQLENIFDKIDPLTLSEYGSCKNILASITKQEWVFAKTVSGEVKPINNSGSSVFEEENSIEQAVRYKTSIVYFSHVWNGGSLIKAMVVDEQGQCRSHEYNIDDGHARFGNQVIDDHSFYAPADQIGDKDRLYSSIDHESDTWSDGRLVRLKTGADESLSIHVLDFRLCATDPTLSPSMLSLVLHPRMFGNEKSKFPTHNDWWTVAFDTLTFMASTPSTLPILLGSRITPTEITNPQQVDWASNFTESQLKQISVFGYKGQFEYKIHLIAAEDSKVLFMMLLQPDSTDRSNHQKDLWILCFRWNPTQARFTFISKLMVPVQSIHHPDVNTYQEEMFPLVAKILHIRNRDFLMVSVGKRPIQVFSLIRKRLVAITINGKPSFELPEMPGQRILIRGLLVNHFSNYSVVPHRDPLTGKTRIDIYAQKCTY